MGHPIQEYQPPIAIRRFVESFWVGDYSQEMVNRVLPDGCSDLILYVTEDTSDVLFVGPMTTAACIPMHAGERFIGVRFTPGTILKHSPASLVAMRDQTLFLPKDYSNRALQLALPKYLSTNNLLDTLEQWVFARIRQEDLIRDVRVDRVLERLQSDPLARIESLYRDLDILPRAMERRFLKMVGLPPKFFARVKRHQWAAKELSASKHVPSMSALAQNLDFADQAHFIRDFNALAGITPGDYRLEQTK